MITTVFVDVDNTLIDFSKCAKIAIEEGFNQCGLNLDKNVYKTFESVNNILWGKIETGELTRPRLLKIRWKTIFDKLHIDYDGEKFEKIFLDNIKNGSQKVDGAEEILMYLSGKYKICVISNAPYEQQISRMTNAGLIKYIDEFFISEKIGYAKPDARFFDACFKKLKSIMRDEVIVIGDSLVADIKGGADYGLKTCWFNYNGIIPPKDIKYDYVINKLSEIKKIL